MHRSLRLSFATLILSAAAAAPVAVAAPAESGRFDFEKLAAAEKGDYVEVNLGRGLLKFAAFVAKHQDPEAAALLAGLSSVRVNVVGLDERNRDAATERVAAVRRELVGQGWEQIVTVRGKKHEDVAVYVKQPTEEQIDGLVVTVIDGRKNEVVFVNIVGRIRAEQLAKLGRHLHIEHLDHVEKAAKG